MTTDADTDLESQIARWRSYTLRRRAMRDSDADELEDHLRGRITDLTEAGLRSDEAFLIAVKRMGRLDEISREFAREHSDRLWKQLVLAPEPDGAAAGRRHDLAAMLVFAALAAIAVKAPAAFGLGLGGEAGFYARNLGPLTLTPLAAYFAWRRRTGPRTLAVMAALVALAAVGANAYPLAADSQSIVLTSIHLPIALWFVVGAAYVGGEWRSGRRRMDFIRFTGEWFIYLVLIGLGGGVLTLFTVGTFGAIGLDAEPFVESWLLPCGAAAAVVVAAWLVEAKQSVVENMAPVLTRVFTPLFTAALLAVLAAIALTGSLIDVERDALILFNLLLVVVLGLLLYSVSARDPEARPGGFDRLQLGLVVSALLIDLLVLLAVAGRIGEWGFSPNKTAALGENIVLFANLAGTAWLLLSFVRNRSPFSRLERWQTGYVGVYAAWVWAVVLVFPPLFAYA
ncbi:permease prefix domain 1-containing protein [Glycomyces xiaoerkulensis]|uniref:permease prefix domain 1-containing protein n=1 Tax=Glycomyces xiaoerkulensis TaxID=2038139 RepID=UPI000C258B32|nr:permease prefix domain 1-containing protein [Glycomyces xiaoerkulensis]